LANLNKSQMRKECILKRDEISLDDILEKSACIITKLNQLDAMKLAKTIMCYVSFGSEVCTHDAINGWLSEGRQVCVPLVIRDSNKGKSMAAIKISSFKELAPGTFGVLEPPLVESNIVEPASIDVVIVPGCAFDLRKNRIGYGAGYYDRFFFGIHGSVMKIGVCFDSQIKDNIPSEEHDVPLDILVTEKRII
jgi:5-formyltetrahydrofolate cyclo-ligase